MAGQYMAHMFGVAVLRAREPDFLMVKFKILGCLLLDPLPRSAPVFPLTDGWAASSALWASLTLTSVFVTISVTRDRPHRQRRRQ
jgi:hypothetical protein